jgi:AcrR family transcriptional regulator
VETYDQRLAPSARDASARRVLVAASQRQRLLDGMARTVARRGYGATAVADVLKTARISRRTFYEQFIDKEDCFLAAYDNFVGRCTERVVGAYEERDGGLAGLGHALATLLGLLAAEPHYARLAIVEALGAGERALTRRDRLLRRVANVLAQIAREHGDPGAAAPELLAQAIVGGIAEVLHAHLLRDDGARLPDLSDDLLRYALASSGIPASG